MLRFLRFIKGYLVIHISGYGAERFLNLCHNRNIFLWDIFYTDHVYAMKISTGDYKEIAEILTKTGTKAAIQKQCGLPYFLSKIKKESGIWLECFWHCLLYYAVIFLSGISDIRATHKYPGKNWRTF